MGSVYEDGEHFVFKYARMWRPEAMGGTRGRPWMTRAGLFWSQRLGARRANGGVGPVSSTESMIRTMRRMNTKRICSFWRGVW